MTHNTYANWRIKEHQWGVFIPFLRHQRRQHQRRQHQRRQHQRRQHQRRQHQRRLPLL